MPWLKAALNWLVDQLIERWPVILTAILGGGGFAYLASVSAFFMAYGPIVLGAVGLLAVLAIGAAVAMLGFGRNRLAYAQYLRSKGLAQGTNVLSPTHTHERIQLHDFYHPFFKPTENVRFEQCDLMGPGNIYLSGCTLLHCAFIECEIVIVRPDRAVTGAMQFKFCTLVRSRLFRATLVMNIEEYMKLPDDIRAGVRVVSDGRVGDL